MSISKPVSLAALRSVAPGLKDHAQEADLDGDKKLTKVEITRYGNTLNDSFAVGNALLTMHPWTQHRRPTLETVAVEDVQSNVDTALEAIARKDTNQNGLIELGAELSAANRLHSFNVLVPLMRVGAVSTDKTAKAVQASVIPELNDFGTSFALTSYPSTLSQIDVLRKTMDAPDDMTDEEIKDAFALSTGDNAAKDFAEKMVSLGEEKRIDADNDDVGEKIEKIFQDVAAAASEEFEASRFEIVEFAEHGIQEDGDTEYRLLIAKENDGAWHVLTFRDFPF